MVDVVPLELFASHSAQVLEAVRVLGDLSDKAGLDAHSARLRQVEAGLAEAASAAGVRAALAAEAPSPGASAAGARQAVAGAGASAVAALRSAPAHPEGQGQGQGQGQAGLTISARDLLAQLEEARLGLRHLRTERQAAAQATERLLLRQLEQLRRGEQILGHDVSSAREELRTAMAEARALVEAVALEAKRARDQAALAYEASTRIGKDAELQRARAATDVSEVRASLSDLSTEVRGLLQSLQQNVDSLQQAEQGQRLSISRQAVSAVAAVEDRLLQRLADTRRDLEARQEQVAELNKSIANRVGEDRSALTALEADLRDLRSRAEAGGLAGPYASLPKTEMPNAWRVALEDAVRRAQFIVDTAHRQSESQHREIEARLKALITEHAKTSVAQEALARALGAEKNAEIALRSAKALEGSVGQLQNVAAEMRSEWRGELQATTASRCAQPEKQEALSNHNRFPVLIVTNDPDIEH